MTKKLLKSIENEIENCKQHLRELEPHIYKNAGAEEKYNRLLIQKAILTDKYKKMLYRKPLIKKIFNIFKFGNKQKLICDFFTGR